LEIEDWRLKIEDWKIGRLKIREIIGKLNPEASG
jgi:hypothetical protein